jgi:hypothetical protein
MPAEKRFETKPPFKTNKKALHPSSGRKAVSFSVLPPGFAYTYTGALFSDTSYPILLTAEPRTCLQYFAPKSLTAFGYFVSPKTFGFRGPRFILQRVCSKGNFGRTRYEACFQSGQALPGKTSSAYFPLLTHIFMFDYQYYRIKREIVNLFLFISIAFLYGNPP